MNCIISKIFLRIAALVLVLIVCCNVCNELATHGNDVHLRSDCGEKKIECQWSNVAVSQLVV